MKIFKGAMTSDGLPHSEMLAYIGSGKHPNIIPLAGKIQHHPDNKDGLVMDLIEPRFKNVAGPPSFETCSRDVYREGMILTFSAAVKLVTGVASAMRHLHTQGESL